MMALAEALDRIVHLKIENGRMREALEIIAGQRQCVDNLMSNQGVALAVLKTIGNERKA
jgi:hypothetical protein